MLLPPLTGLTTQGPLTFWSVGVVRSWKGGVGMPTVCQARLVATLSMPSRLAALPLPTKGRPRFSRIA